MQDTNTPTRDYKLFEGTIAQVNLASRLAASLCAMWLINMGHDERLSGVADYFTPYQELLAAWEARA